MTRGAVEELGVNTHPIQIDFDRLLKLRLVVARHGEMDAARWWNTQGVLGRRGAVVLKRGFPATHYFAQARIVFAVARSRCGELFDPPGCMTLWNLPAETEDQFEERWQAWLDEVDAWSPFFEALAAQAGHDLLGSLRQFELLTEAHLDAVGKLRRSAENRAVPLTGTHITPGDLARRGLELIARRRPGKTLLFVVDEVGQFVARDVQKMLDLQAVVQNLGRIGRGKMWLMVTSQEKLTELVGGLDDKRVELARLMDRFPLQVRLEPADISEVTSKRVLSKNAGAEKKLRELFKQCSGRLEKVTVDQLVTERTSTAVKDALKSLLEAPAPSAGRGAGRKKATRASGARRKRASASPTDTARSDVKGDV
jgi:hypothetical protein